MLTIGMSAGMLAITPALTTTMQNIRVQHIGQGQ
jgi:hypothetical protein